MSFKTVSASISVIASTFRTFLTGLPIGQDDKTRIDEIIKALEAASGELAGVSVQKITVRKSDVVAAVNAVLPAMVEEAVKKLLASSDNAGETSQ